MKKQNRLLFSILSIAILGIFLIGSGSSAWKQKQFDSYEELGAAFKGVSYDDIKEEFGEPSYKRISFGQETQIIYAWKGVGVKGKGDAYMYFSVSEYLTGFYKGYRFETVYASEATFPRSNDDEFHID